MIDAENCDVEDESEGEDDEEYTPSCSDPNLWILLSADTVTEQMNVRIRAELLQPSAQLYTNAKNLNGRDGVVEKVEKASGLVLFSENAGNGDDGVWLPVSCLLLIVNDQYQTWLAQHTNPVIISADGDDAIEGERYYQKQLGHLQEAAGDRVNAQLMDKVASAVLE